MLQIVEEINSTNRDMVWGPTQRKLISITSERSINPKANKPDHLINIDQKDGAEILLSTINCRGILTRGMVQRSSDSSNQFYH